MADFSFTRTTNKIQINSYVDEYPRHYRLQADDHNNILLIKGEDGAYTAQINLNNQTVEVNGEDFSGTATELKQLLYDEVFNMDISSGSGGSGLGSYILSAPDDSQWLLGVNDSGSLVTEAVDNPVGASALTSLTLRSPDNTQWQVSVNNAGTLTTAAV